MGAAGIALRYKSFVRRGFGGEFCGFGFFQVRDGVRRLGSGPRSRPKHVFFVMERKHLRTGNPAKNFWAILFWAFRWAEGIFGMHGGPLQGAERRCHPFCSGTFLFLPLFPRKVASSEFSASRFTFVAARVRQRAGPGAETEWVFIEVGPGLCGARGRNQAKGHGGKFDGEFARLGEKGGAGASWGGFKPGGLADFKPDSADGGSSALERFGIDFSVFDWGSRFSYEKPGGGGWPGRGVGRAPETGKGGAGVGWDFFVRRVQSWVTFSKGSGENGGAVGGNFPMMLSRHSGLADQGFGENWARVCFCW